MREATFNGPQGALRLRDSGRVLKRGVRTEVTNAEADRLAQADVDVTVHQAEPDDGD